MRSLITAAAALLMATTAFAAREVVHQFESSAAAPSVKRLVIDVPAGSITVRNGADGTIRVTGTARRDYDDSPTYDQQIVNDTSAEVYVNRDEAVVRRRFGARAEGWRAQRFTTFDLAIEVPRGTALVFETSRGNVDMRGSFGDINVSLRAGNVSLTTPRADVRDLSASCRVGSATTNMGSEIVQREGLLPGNTQYFNAEGRTNVKLHVTAGGLVVTLTH